MGEQPPPTVGFEELRRKFVETHSVEPAKFHALIETPGNFIYTYPLKKHGVIRFQRWTVEQVNRLAFLPFFVKLDGKQELSVEEETQFSEFRRELVREALVDAGKWQKELFDDEFVDSLFTLIGYVSGVHEEFDAQLESFMKSEEGYLYGQLWFTLFGKTPSEVAALPHSDVKTVNAWLAAYASRLNPGGR